MSDRDIIDECRRRLRLAQDAESTNRTEAITDLQFCGGEQWPTEIKRDRDTDGRPCLTINITDAMVRRVTNAIRENRPRIKFHPVGNGADVQTAKVRNGIMRHIEAASGADFAYDCAAESAVRGGWGYIRVNSKYVADDSFDQDLTIVAIRNPFTVYMDPTSRMPDGSDANWCITSDWISRAEYAERFGKGAPDYSRIRSIAAAFNFLGQGDDIQDWSRKEDVRLAEYWRVKLERDTLVEYSDGTTELESKKTQKPDHIKPVRKRLAMVRRVEWYLIDAEQILDKRKWPGKWIPIVPVYGRELDLNGKIVRKGMTRDLRDPARMYNYAQTAKTETYALLPKAPWLGAEGFMDGHEPAWRDANRKPIVALEYKPVRLEDGSYAPPPLRQEPPQPNAGFAEWGESTKSDFLAVAGMPNDPGQDARGEVVSGLAIKRRQGLADVSHYDFYDNLTRSMRHIGNIVSDLIPYYYDTPDRVQRIIGDDGTPDQATINKLQRDPITHAILKVENDMTGGYYDCVVDTGPGYQTRREEAAEAMLELMGTPLGEMTAKVAGDVVVRSLDFPDSELIADRMAALIPAAQVDKSSDIPPKAQIIIKTLQGQLQQMQQELLGMKLEQKAKAHVEMMRQSGETDRTRIKESAETERTQMELGVRREDAMTKAHTAIHDTHVKAQTAHDVAEINAAAQLLNTHVEAAHQKELAKETAKAAESAEKRAE